MLRELLVGFVILALCGCGTTRNTDTARAATEMLLVSQAVDRAVSQIDFSPLRSRAIFLDTSQIDNSIVDKGYLISSLRQQLLSHGALVMEDKRDAVYVVEARVGALATDRNSLLFGTPQLSLPAVVPGIPTSLPELALYKRTDQKGVAKIGVFAYNRITGRAVWQSGLVEDRSNLKDRWLLGSGPYSSGSIRSQTTLAGEELPQTLTQFPQIPFIGTEHESLDNSSSKMVPTILPTEAVHWQNADAPAPPQPIPVALLGVTGIAPILHHPIMR